MIIISSCGNEHYETVYTDRFFKCVVSIMQISMGFNPHVLSDAVGFLTKVKLLS
ncbi:hypothetical protein IMY05_001G0126200 [Salix suchowensis]|nr:hypothetical protein IMY05_001G0126200 [Salix suchowensis]